MGVKEYAENPIKSRRKYWCSMETKQDNIVEGICGKSLTWFFNNEDGILTIKGSGEMDSYDKEPAPWDGYVIKKIVLPQGLLNISPCAFDECGKLESINIPNTITCIGDYAFSDCLGLTSIKFPDSITSIGYSAFNGCDNLTSIEIPNSVKSIGERAFAYCGMLTSFDVAKDNPNYCSENGVLFSKDKKTLIQYPACKSDVKYSIPNSITNIEEKAFFNCRKLENVIIPNSVTNIGDYAFMDCNALISITSLATVPPSLLGTDVFEGVDKLILVFVPQESVEAYKTAEGWREFTNIQPMLR